jgi:hypothetical protein
MPRTRKSGDAHRCVWPSKALLRPPLLGCAPTRTEATPRTQDTVPDPKPEPEPGAGGEIGSRLV